MSHWVLDVISHPADMPLSPGVASRWGLGLWTSVPATIAIEGGVWLLALGLFVHHRDALPRGRQIVLWVGAALITAVWLGNIAGPPPANPAFAPLASLILFTVIVAWAYWIDRRRGTGIGPGARTLASTVALVFVSAVVTGQSRDLVIVHVNVVDVVEGRILPDRTVRIRGDRIARIDRGRPLTGADVVDAGGWYLIPGLWDMHAHLQMSGASALPLYVANGVTGVRDMGSDLEAILELRSAAVNGRTLGPRIIAAGPILDDAPQGFPYRLRVKTAAEGVAAVRMLKARGVDFVKVHDRTPREAYFAIAAEARRQHLPLSGHVPRGITYDEAMAAGQRSFEHLAGLRLFTPCTGGPGYNPAACRPFFETLAQRRVWQTPTLLAWRELPSVGTSASGVDRSQLAFVSATLRAAWDANRQASNVNPDVVGRFVAASELAATVTADMVKAGVGVLAGCDGMIPGFCVHDELALMVRGGMSPVDALRTATVNPARYLGIERSAGAVAAGYRADLVLLDGNPLEEIASTRRLRGVIVGGRMLDRASLDVVLGDVRRAGQPASGP